MIFTISFMGYLKSITLIDLSVFLAFEWQNGQNL